MINKLSIKNIFLTTVLLSILVGCSGASRQLTKEEKIYSPRDRSRLEQMEAGGGLINDLFKVGKDNEESNYTNNTNKSSIWRASLEILSTFPLSSIDSKSGVIITDWYSSEKKPSERFKITILILSQEISSNSIQVKIHKQIIKNSRWVNIKLKQEKNLAIERKIIQKAVEIRSQSS